MLKQQARRHGYADTQWPSILRGAGGAGVEGELTQEVHWLPGNGGEVSDELGEGREGLGRPRRGHRTSRCRMPVDQWHGTSLEYLLIGLSSKSGTLRPG